MIPITKPFIPPIEEYQNYLKGIWSREWLTNMGPLASKLEMDLKEYLNLNHLLFVTNGTVALQMAIKALEINGEIITTPFSFVATTSSIVWEGCKPIFVDIDPETLNIDPKKIIASITEDTKAILATHVYGNPCDVLAIEEIAKQFNLKVIYDGAHSFGVKINSRSIFEYGDISICSLHATKLYHSTEGGLVFTKDPNLLKKLSLIRNFGITGFDSFGELGINGKNSEFHAAMGLVNLKYIDQIIARRLEIINRYSEKLENFKAVNPKWHKDSENNGAYLPYIISSENLLLKIKKALDANEIFTRRYFYPSLSSSLPYLDSVEMPISDDLSKRMLCLPLYYDLTNEEVDWICRLILREQNN